MACWTSPSSAARAASRASTVRSCSPCASRSPSTRSSSRAQRVRSVSPSRRPRRSPAADRRRGGGGGGGGGGGMIDAEQKPALTYGPPGPEITFAGVGSPLAAARVIPGPLTGLKVIGTDVAGDFSAVVIDSPKFSAGWDKVPNLQFTVADPQGDLLWHQRAIWQRGGAGHLAGPGHAPGRDHVLPRRAYHRAAGAELHRLDRLRAAEPQGTPRHQQGVHGATSLTQELQLAGLDPNRVLLGEAVPTQSEISRDISDEQTQTDSQDSPSGWTTIVRLAKVRKTRFHLRQQDRIRLRPVRPALVRPRRPAAGLAQHRPRSATTRDSARPWRPG